jgi:WD40 repeat protein
MANPCLPPGLCWPPSLAGGYSSKITGLCWSSSSRFLATSGGNQVTIWDLILRYRVP